MQGAIRREEPLTRLPWDSHYIYDIETYPNCFSLGAIHYETGTRYCFEISSRVNQAEQLWQWLEYLRNNRVRMVGFNNIGFDYPVMHSFMRGGHSCELLYNKAQAIFDAQNKGDRFSQGVWPSDWFIPQVDLFKIHHFDNKAKMTSLKALEFAMRMESIEDLPYKPGTILTDEEIANLVSYMMHDVEATRDFFDHSQEQLKLRDDFTEQFGYDFTNCNDTKIGEQYMILKLEEAGVQCYDYSTGRKRPKKSPRPNGIKLGEVLFDFIGFTHPNLQRVHEWLKAKTVFDTREALSFDPTPDNPKGERLSAKVNGFTFDFGLGGIHGSVESQLVESDAEHVIIDVDVTSYYPSIPIAHSIYPEHLGDVWCSETANLKQMRLEHAKGTPLNAAGKLAMNGSYGKTNSEYSPFFDPQYTMAVTINGQLMLAMLSEWALGIAGLTMVQANTDGITVRLPRARLEAFRRLCKLWECQTGLELEEAEYSRMWVRDVNNYLAEYAGSGKLKHIGAYVSKKGPDNPQRPDWHKDMSAMVVPKVAVKYLTEGGDIEEMIRNHTDRMDFMLRAKVRRADKLLWGEEEVQHLTRYYVCDDSQGRYLSKQMIMTENQRAQCQTGIIKDEAKLAKYAQKLKDWEAAGKTHLASYIKTRDVMVPRVTEELNERKEQLRLGGRRTAIQAGYTVQVCNHMRDALFPVNVAYYASEVRKLVAPFVRGAVA